MRKLIESTLISIDGVIESPDQWSIFDEESVHHALAELDGEPVVFRSAREAADRGIAIIHQELSLFANMSVADNLFMARERVQARGVIMREGKNGEDAATAEGGWLDWLGDNGIAAIGGITAATALIAMAAGVE